EQAKDLFHNEIELYYIKNIIRPDKKILALIRPGASLQEHISVVGVEDKYSERKITHYARSIYREFNKAYSKNKYDKTLQLIEDLHTLHNQNKKTADRLPFWK